MKSKYKNLSLLIYFSKIRKNIFKNKQHTKSIIAYIPPKKSIVTYIPPKKSIIR